MHEARGLQCDDEFSRDDAEDESELLPDPCVQLHLAEKVHEEMLSNDLAENQNEGIRDGAGVDMGDFENERVGI